jgi:hypothetical protein
MDIMHIDDVINNANASCFYAVMNAALSFRLLSVTGTRSHCDTYCAIQHYRYMAPPYDRDADVMWYDIHRYIA